MKKSFCFLSILALFLMLVWMTSSDKVSTSFEKSFSMVEFNNQVIGFGVVLSVNQATNFNHLNQTVFDYIFIILLVLFLVIAVNYQWHKPIPLPPPWYMCLRFCCRDKISAWKSSNVQYKTLRAYQQ